MIVTAALAVAGLLALALGGVHVFFPVPLYLGRRRGDVIVIVRFGTLAVLHLVAAWP